MTPLHFTACIQRPPWKDTSCFISFQTLNTLPHRQWLDQSRVKAPAFNSRKTKSMHQQSKFLPPTWLYCIFFVVMWVCICIHMHIYVHACEGQRPTLSIVPQMSPILYFGDNCLTANSSRRLCWLPNEPQRPSCLCLPSTSITNTDLIACCGVVIVVIIVVLNDF